jgi:chromate reductase
MVTGSKTVKITAFGGSFRKDSYNTKLLKECQKLMPEGSELEIVSIKDIPLYNQDLDENQPEPVRIFRNQIIKADGFLIATPEYDFSIPGFLKNTLDYISRPPMENPFTGKIGAIMSASPSMLGGSRAQYHLRQVMGFMDARVINRPEVFISFAHTKFDENGHLTDEMAIDLIKKLLERLVDEIRKQKNILN